MMHPAAEPATPAWREVATDALLYWEPRRILYNVVLALVVVGHFLAALPGARTRLSWDTLFVLFLLAVLANVCYSAAYLADLFVQLSGFRIAWTRWRLGTVPRRDSCRFDRRSLLRRGDLRRHRGALIRSPPYESDRRAAALALASR